MRSLGLSFVGVMWLVAASQLIPCQTVVHFTCPLAFWLRSIDRELSKLLYVVSVGASTCEVTGNAFKGKQGLSAPRMTHHTETPHMSQLQKARLSVGENSAYICAVCFSCSGPSLETYWSPECSIFSSEILHLRKRNRSL
jgi:hypothetical protein